MVIVTTSQSSISRTLLSLKKYFPTRNALFLAEFWPNGSTGLLSLARKPFEISIMSNDQDNGLVHHACVP